MTNLKHGTEHLGIIGKSRRLGVICSVPILF